VVALMLDANPNLGWRDVQNILARTAVQNDLGDADWDANPSLPGVQNNAAGLHVNHKYGFGLVDASAAVAMANPATYINMPRAASFLSGVVVPDIDNQNIPDNVFVDGAYEGVQSTFNVSRNMIVEHVEVVFNSSENLNQEPPGTGGYRGDLKLVLTSPSGTVSILSEPHSDSAPDYTGWKFMTVRNWGESSLGTWTLRITDEKGGGVSVFDSWQLILHGTGKDIFANTARLTPDFSYDQGWRADLHPRVTGDVNGDGKDDLVGFGYGGVFVTLSNGTTFNPVGRWTTDFSYDQGWRAELHPRLVGDVNGDLLDDIVGFGYEGVSVALSNGATFDAIQNYWTTDFSYAQGWRAGLHPRMLGDMNGDGMDDLIGFGYEGIFVALSNGSGFDAVKKWTGDYSYNQGWRIALNPRMTGDVDGDGMDDVVGYGTTGVWVALSDGTKFLPVSRWTTDFSEAQGWRTELHPRMVADLNGDGTDDLIGFGYGGVFVALSEGSRFLPVSRWSTDYSYDQGWRIAFHPRMVGDVNGDLMDDVVGFGSTGAWIAIAQ